jgi:UDP-N-acetylmuramate dehydrogenase
MIFADGFLDIAVLKMDIPGFSILQESQENVFVRVGAGEDWDGVVALSVSDGLSGIEALSLIPGSVGATPIQNVGAYGQEISDVLVEVGVFDTETLEHKTIQKDDCKFSYRDSVFKTKEGKRFIVTDVLLKLSKKEPETPIYDSLAKLLNDRGIKKPSLEQIRDAVIKIRTDKLPDPAVLPNMGSFFKNPFVTKEKADELSYLFPEIKRFDDSSGKVKLFAGWLIEQAGFRGAQLGKIKVHEENALVLINNMDGTFTDLMDAGNQIKKKVKDIFDVDLEMEPQIVR